MHSTQKLLLFHHLSIIAGLFYYGFNIQYALIILFGCIVWAYIVGHKGLHMYMAHTKYKDCIKSYLYTFGALITGVGSPLTFAATHRQHHAYHDTEKDPHSPEHIGWYNVWLMNYNSQYISPRLVKDFLKSDFQKFMNRLLKYIYYKSSRFLQNIYCSLYGLYIIKDRYNNIFEKYFKNNLETSHEEWNQILDLADNNYIKCMGIPQY